MSVRLQFTILLTSFQNSEMYNITRVEFQNGKNYPPLKVINCDVKVKDEDFERYRKRIRQVYQKRLGINLTILFTYRTIEP
jgi:hypothetical protein